MCAHEITSKPTTAAPANASRFDFRLHAFDITCRLSNGHETTITTIAANSCMAIGHCAQVFDDLQGVKVRTL